MVGFCIVQHVDTSEYDAFDFVRDHGMAWVKAKDKRPLEAWKSKGIRHTANDVDLMNEFRSQGVNEVAILTEPSKLLVIDVDVTLASNDQRSDNPLYAPFLLENGNFMDGLVNFMDVLRLKASGLLKASNKSLSDEFMALAINLGLFAYALQRHEYLPPKPFNAVARTPTGGLHFYFKCEHPERYKLNAGEVCNHVDVRAGGGVIIAPYSYRKPELKEGKKRPYADAYIPLTDFNTMQDLPSYFDLILPKKSEHKTPAPAIDMQTIRRHRFSFNSYDQDKDQRQHQTFLSKFAQSVAGERNTNLSKYYPLSLRCRTINESQVKADYWRVAKALAMNDAEITATMKSSEAWAQSVGKFAV